MQTYTTEWFVEQVKGEQAHLRASIRALGVRAEAVDDIAQDALVIAFKKLETFGQDGQANFGAWVCGIARKLVANARRKEQRREVILSDYLAETLSEADSRDWHPLAADRDVDQTVALRKCLAQLPAASRELIRMRYFQELSIGEIASRLERTTNDVRQLLFRLRKSLLVAVKNEMAGNC